MKPKIGHPFVVDLMVVEVIFEVGRFVRLEKVSKANGEDEYHLNVFWYSFTLRRQ